MTQWEPAPGREHPGPGWEPGAAAPPAPVPGGPGYPPGGRYPGQEPGGWGQEPGSWYPGQARAALVPGQYRQLRARTTRAIALLGVFAVAILAALIAGFGRYSVSSGALAASALLLTAARIGQLRSRRRRLVSLAGDVAPQYAQPAARPAAADYGPSAARGPQGRPAFSQQFCSVTRVTAGGNLNTGMPAAEFLVRISAGRLVTEAPGYPGLHRPARQVEITTPRWQRKIGAGSILRLGGQLWSVQFNKVYQAEAAQASRGGALRVMVTAGAPWRSIRRGREINERFTAALLASGAADTSAAPAYS